MFRLLRLLMMALGGLFFWATQISGQSENYNIRIGSTYLDLNSTSSFTYDTNASYVEDNEVSDFVIRTGIEARGLWEINSRQDINFNFGIAYAHYLDNGELSGFENSANFSPRNEISFDFRVSNFDFSLYDRFAYLTNASEVNRQNNNAEEVNTSEREFAFFQRIENEIGLIGVADFNVLILQLEAGRNDVFPIASSFSYTERVDYFFGGAISKQLRETLLVGLSGRYTFFTYEDEVQNDGSTVSVGPFLTWDFSDNLSLQTSAGYYYSQFDENGSINDNSDASGISFRIELSHIASNTYTHQISFQQSNNLGSLSNTTLTRGVSYNFNWTGIKDYPVTGSLYYNVGEDSASLFAEDFSRWGANLEISKKLSRKLDIGLFLQAETKDSNRAERDYNRYQAGIRVVYDL